jgi:hypothetical protein
MAFIPLGFAFAAKDKGLGDQFKRARKAMGGLNADLDETSRKGGGARDAFFSMGQAARLATKGMVAPFKLTGKLLGGLERRVAQFNLASIADGMKGLTGEAGNLSDELDSAFASNAKAVRPLLAGIGKSGKELRKLTAQASSMAYSMDVSAETVGKVMVELETAGGPAKRGLDALNMSVSDFVKFTEVSGVETAKLGSVMGDMQTSWNMTDKQARATADAVLGYGQAAGIGTEGLKGLDGLMEKFNATLADAPPEMQVTAEQMQGMVIGATKLAGAYREMGASQEQAMEFSTQTAELFTKESVAFQRAAEGRGEYGDMTKSLMSTMKQWGTWEEFGAALKVGALDSTKGMIQLNKIVQQASAKGFGPADVLMRQLLGTIQETSPSMAWLAQNTNDGRAALERFDAMSIKTDGSIKKLGQDGFSTGFTLQESFDRARKGMDHAIRSIAGKEVQGMVRAQMGAYRDTGREIVKLGKDKTWGPLLKKAVILKRMGVRGLFMSGAKSKADMQAMGKTFAKMELAAGAIEDITGAASPLMSVLGKFGPMGTAIGGIATWFSMDQGTRDEIWASVAPLVDTVKAKLGDIWLGTADATGKRAGGLKANLIKAWDEFTTWLKGNAPGFMASVGSMVVDGVTSALGTGGVAIAGALGAAMLGGALFGGGGKGSLAFAVAGALAAGVGIAISNLNAGLDKAVGEGKGAIGAKGIVTRGGVRERNAAQRYKAQQFGVRGENVSAESIAGAYEAGGLSEYGGNVDYAMMLRKHPEMDTLRKRMEQLQQLPEVQARLLESSKSGGVAVVQEMERIKAEYASVSQDTLNAMLDQAGAIDLAIAELDAMGVSQTAGGMEQAQYNVAARSADFLANKAIMDQEIAGIRADVSSQLVEMNNIAQAGGINMMDGLASGVGVGAQGVGDAVAGALSAQVVDQIKGHSPPNSGPLSSAAGNPMFEGGQNMMWLIADGIDAGAVSVQDAMAEALVSSYQYAMGKYAEAVQADLSVQGVMTQVADQIVANLSGIGRINMGDMQISAEEKNVIRASLDVPGMAGLAGAVIADGNLTRKILTRIADATEGTFNVLSGAKPNAKGGTGIVLAGA